MNKKMNIAVIGIDSSHTLEYVRRMQDESFDAAQRVHTLQAVSCMTLVTPFQNAEGVAARSELLRNLHVAVTTDFATAVANADAVMVELNDPATHVEYMEKCLKLGKPVFLDKPLADTYENGQKIIAAVRRANAKFFTSSPLRFAADVQAAHQALPLPESCYLWGPIGQAASGSNLVWYGIHVFEMLNLLMGRGAVSVQCMADEAGLLCTILYQGNRRAVIELTKQAYRYGGVLRDRFTPEILFNVNAPNAEFYGETLKQIEKFFHTGVAPVAMEDALEIMKMLSAADDSANAGGQIIKL